MTKRYLVTGASSGVGLAVARSLIEQGNEVLGMSRRPPHCVAVTWIPIDHDDPDRIGGVYSETIGIAKTVGPFSGIFHAAGHEVIAPLRATTEAQYRNAMMAADVAFGLLRAAARAGTMDDGGSVVLMSSVAGLRGTAGMAAYSAGKAAIEGMTRSAAAELAQWSIRVNAIAAGGFLSPMHTRVTARMTDARVAAYRSAHRLGFGNVDEIRDAALFLLGDSSKWITGTTMVVDGGYSA